MRSVWTKRLAVAFAATALFAATAPAPALADPIPAGGMTLADVNSFLRSMGFQTQPDEKNSAVIATTDKGGKFIVIANDCENGRCKSLEYLAILTFDGGVRPDDASAAVLMNGWNLDSRWLRASATPSPTRAVALESEFLLIPKVDTDDLTLSLAVYLDSIPEFIKYLEKANTASPLTPPSTSVPK